jgi:hypothetical protein
MADNRRNQARLDRGKTEMGILARLEGISERLHPDHDVPLRFLRIS